MINQILQSEKPCRVFYIRKSWNGLYWRNGWADWGAIYGHHDLHCKICKLVKFEGHYCKDSYNRCTPHHKAQQTMARPPGKAAGQKRQPEATRKATRARWQRGSRTGCTLSRPPRAGGSCRGRGPWWFSSGRQSHTRVWMDEMKNPSGGTLQSRCSLRFSLVRHPHTRTLVYKFGFKCRPDRPAARIFLFVHPKPIISCLHDIILFCFISCFILLFILYCIVRLYIYI